jgi:HK97 family phage portal protein
MDWRSWFNWVPKWNSPPRNQTYSISDPRVGYLFGAPPDNDSGVTVGEAGALGLSAVYRAVALISGTIAQLPLRTLWEKPTGVVRIQNSLFENPDGPDGQTKFEWTEMLLVHLLMHGNAYLRHVYTGSGALYSLSLVHPLFVHIELPLRGEPQPKGGKWFIVTYPDGTSEKLDANNMTHIPAMTTDGIYGLSPITVGRLSLGVGIAGDRAAARVFSTGAMITGFMVPDDDLETGEPEQISDAIAGSVGGYENAGRIPVINRKLKFVAVNRSAADAQFLQSRQFSIEEVARWFGVPPHLLMQTDKQTSWGTGVSEQNDGLGRFTLAPWTARIEQRLSRLIRESSKYVEFDFAGLKRPTFAEEVRLLIEQTGRKPLMTQNEARHILNMEPVEGGDVLNAPVTEPLQGGTEDGESGDEEGSDDAE